MWGYIFNMSEKQLNQAVITSGVRKTVQRYGFLGTVRLIQLVAEVLGKSAIAQRLCDNLQLDTTKKALLGWSPLLCLDAGLRITANWYLKK
jgi:nucleoside-diphosphate-sugar epimerase